MFSVVSPTIAAQIRTEQNFDNSMGIIIEGSSDTIDGSKTTAQDLGDDQSFPFIPGFGKNSRKD
tara:strand:- start:308 stop:499 length:192 start_codon:yes stop_codon:yes gene_type:complete